MLPIYGINPNYTDSIAIVAPKKPYALSGSGNADHFVNTAMPKVLFSGSLMSFRDAARQGNYAALKYHLESGADPDESVSMGDNTALMYAAQKGHMDIVNLLLEHSANPNKGKVDGWTPLMFSVEKNNPPIVKRLLEAGADPNQLCGWLGLTPILKKALLNVTGSFTSNGRKRGMEIVELLLDYGAKVRIEDFDGLKKVELHGSTELKNLLKLALLRDAILDDNLEEIDKALEAGIKINQLINKDGDTPLILAVRRGNVEVLERLLAYNADPTLENNRGETALSIAKQSGQKDLETTLQSYIKLNFNLHSSVKSGNVKAVRQLATAGVSFNQRNESNETPLLVATRTCQGREMVQVLLDNDADPNFAGDKGYTPLIWATVNRLNVVDLLLCNGADPNQPDADGRTPLLIAATMGFTDIAKALHAAGADPEIKDAEGKNAIQAAKLRGHKQLADSLQSTVAAKAALFKAINTENLKAVKVLIDGGADLEKTDDDGNTPLMLAAAKGHLPIVLLLLQNGADPEKRNHTRKTAAWMAVVNGHTEVFEALAANQ